MPNELENKRIINRFEKEKGAELDVRKSITRKIRMRIKAIEEERMKESQKVEAENHSQKIKIAMYRCYVNKLLHRLGENQIDFDEWPHFKIF